MQQKKVWANIVKSKPVLALLCLLLLFFAWNVVRFWVKMGDTERNKDLAEDKVNSLKIQKEKLVADIENLQTEEGKEKFFRENFGLVKDGEEVVIIVDEKEELQKESNGFSSPFMNFLRNLFSD